MSHRRASRSHGLNPRNQMDRILCIASTTLRWTRLILQCRKTIPRMECAAMLAFIITRWKDWVSWRLTNFTEKQKQEKKWEVSSTPTVFFSFSFYFKSPSPNTRSSLSPSQHDMMAMHQLRFSNGPMLQPHQRQLSRISPVKRTEPSCCAGNGQRFTTPLTITSPAIKTLSGIATDNFRLTHRHRTWRLRYDSVTI